MLEWYINKEDVNPDLQNYWSWALPAFKYDKDFFTN